MRKLFLALILALAVAGAAHAQNPTAVTGTLVDPNGVPFYPATVTACLSPFTRDPLANGIHVNSAAGSGGNYCPGNSATSPTGAFSMNIYPNAAITPGATQYQFTVSTTGTAPPAGKGSQTYNVTVTVSGSSQDVSASLNAAASSLLVGGGLPFAAALPGTCTPGVTPAVELSVTAFTINYCSASNTWSPLGSSTASVIGTAGQSGYFSASNTVSGGTIVLDMAGVAGADLGAKMNNCATALPAAGGTCMGDNLTGAQTLSSAVTTAKPVTYTFSGQAISQSAAITLSNANSGINGCRGVQPTFTKAGNIDQITMNANNTFVRCIGLAGVGGTFTGSGIVATVSVNNGWIEKNNIATEAANGIKDASTSTQISYNFVAQNSATQAILSTGNGGVIMGNIVTPTQGDGITTQGNQAMVIGNIVNLTLTNATSGACAINANGDQIGVRVAFNETQISDTHGADVNYGICDTPTGTHNLNMLFEGNHHFGVVSGGATAFGFFLNNAANLNTNWSVTVRDEGCVHLTTCIKRTDTQNNKSIYENIEPSDTTLDNGTGSTADVWLQPLAANGSSFALLPTPAGGGSTIYCTDCTIGKVVTSGGSGGVIYREAVPGGSTNWTSHASAYYPSSAYTNATTTASNITGLAVPVGASTQYGIECNLFYQGSVNTAGLDVTVTGPAAPSFVITEYEEFFGTSANNSRANAFASKMAGATTTDTNFNLAKVVIGLSNGSNAGTVQIQGSATGVGTVTVYQNSYCVAF